MYKRQGVLHPLYPRLGQPRHAHRVRHHQEEQAQPEEDERPRIPLRLPRVRPALRGRADGGVQAPGRGGRLGAPLPDHGPRLRGRGGENLRRDVQEGGHLQGPQAGVLVPPRRDRPGGGGDRVPGRPRHHRVREVPYA